MTDNRLTDLALHDIDKSYDDAGRNFAELGPCDRRRIVATMVRAIGRHCPEAVADLAACASFTVALGGAR